MTRVTASKDCGNSPKNRFLEELTVAFARGDRDFILRNVAENIEWHIIGSRQIVGQAEFAAELTRVQNDKAVELIIHHVATHGKAGAVDGTITRKSGQRQAFCDVYEFNGAKGTSVKAITSYVIDLK